MLTTTSNYFLKFIRHLFNISLFPQLFMIIRRESHIFSTFSLIQKASSYLLNYSLLLFTPMAFEVASAPEETHKLLLSELLLFARFFNNSQTMLSLTQYYNMIRHSPTHTPKVFTLYCIHLNISHLTKIKSIIHLYFTFALRAPYVYLCILLCWKRVFVRHISLSA